jgi:3-phenylpropionate/trans-cinnamate dioxygenase ferredoxin reductase subunit
VRPETIVIAGAGHAAGQAVASLKQHRFGGRIILIGDEPYLPYQRPPLSKKFLAGNMSAERLFFKPPSFYDDPDIDLHLGTRLEGIERASKKLVTADGSRFSYDKLILALGARARKVRVSGSQLGGIHYLRGIDDVERLKAEIAPGKRIVIVGAGYIGLEVAAVCRQLELIVTVIEMADRVMNRVVSEPVSDFYEHLHRERGVDLRLNTSLAGFKGEGTIEAVATDHGVDIEADVALVGIGIVPNVEIAAQAGLDVNNGIVVDDRCRTSDADIYAIGDCTLHPNSIYGRSVRLESVHNALEQAKTAAANACGIDCRYSQVPWFWSDQYEVKLQIAGLSAGYDHTVLRGDPDAASFACFYLRDGRLIATDAINSPREFMQSKGLIARRAEVTADRLADARVPLKDLG